MITLTDYDRKVYETELKDFLPNEFIDCHVHVYKKDFPLDLSDDGESVFIGSIAVCVERAEEQAIEYGHSLEKEMTYLLIHGLLHLMGYDHIDENDKKEMRSIEKAVLLRLKVSEE